jgi:hypothetical protein
MEKGEKKPDFPGNSPNMGVNFWPKSVFLFDISFSLTKTLKKTIETRYYIANACP